MARRRRPAEAADGEDVARRVRLAAEQWVAEQPVAVQDVAVQRPTATRRRTVPHKAKPGVDVALRCRRPKDLAGHRQAAGLRIGQATARFSPVS
jgi:hypothetical protein